MSGDVDRRPLGGIGEGIQAEGRPLDGVNPEKYVRYIAS
jgi:hypothetical protein